MANFFKRIKKFATDGGDLDVSALMSAKDLAEADHKSGETGGIEAGGQFNSATPVTNAVAAARLANAQPAFAPAKDMGEVNALAQAAAAQMDQGLSLSPFNAGNGPTPYPSSLSDED
ncbi:MAG: hypothetical protein K0Q57_817 [Gammaproteobacteria bacterium]|jgi:hypothetical protein|nr:hypothetical protein [Gammaproteobacteria bacterium]